MSLYLSRLLGYTSRRSQRVASLARLPGDLLLEISSYLTRQELFDLCLTCRHISGHLVYALYSDVVLTGEEQAVITLGFLCRHREIARHVQSLTLRPNIDGKKAWNGHIIAVSVRQVARHLDALHTFKWEAEEIPPFDDMWFALRTSCHRLVNIATTIGSWPLSPESHLLDFSNLKSFSLTLQLPFYADHVGFPMHEELPASNRLWDMLIRRCPNLEELTVEGTYALSADAHLLANGFWPKLRRLSLGDVIIDWEAADHVKRPFIRFLERHDTIQSLRVSRHILPHSQVPTLEVSALPNLKEFCGTLEQLQALPHLHKNIEKIDFREPMMMREITPLAVASALQNLPALTELKITFALHSMYDSTSLLRSLVSACPQLLHLELACAQKPSFQLETFSKAIHDLHRLHSLKLTMEKFPGDEPISAGAVRIARGNPRLQKFSITLLPPVTPAHFAPALRLPLPPVRESGQYVLTCDAHGLPMSLDAREQRVSLWGLRRTSTRYRHDLRPGCVRKSWGALLFDRSPAGEELRMLLFSFLLVVLAVWGFAAAGQWRLLSRSVLKASS